MINTALKLQIRVKITGSFYCVHTYMYTYIHACIHMYGCECIESTDVHSESNSTAIRIMKVFITSYIRKLSYASRV